MNSPSAFERGSVSYKNGVLSELKDFDIAYTSNVQGLQ